MIYGPDEVREHKYDFFNSDSKHGLLNRFVVVRESIHEQQYGGRVKAMTLTPAGMTLIFEDWTSFTWTFSTDVVITTS